MPKIKTVFVTVPITLVAFYATAVLGTRKHNVSSSKPLACPAHGLASPAALAPRDQQRQHPGKLLVLDFKCKKQQFK